MIPTLYNSPISSSYCLTASYTSEYVSPKPKDKGVIEFFEMLGYKVTHDRGNYEFWYNIIDETGTIAQIDQGIPLDDIITDICQFHLGKEGISKLDYTISGPDTPEMRLLFKRVFDYKMYRIMPDGQLIMNL